MLKYSLFLVNSILALLLFICRFITDINPFEQPVVGILAYMVPVLVILNLFFVVIWLVSRKYFFILPSLLALILTSEISSKHFAFNPFQSQHQSTNTDSVLSVLSYNVRLMDLYNWSGDKNTHQNMLAFFKKENADLLCLQEFYTGNDSIGVDNIRAIQMACGYKYVHMADINTNKRGRWGSVIFSHYPMIDRRSYDIDVIGSNMLQQVEILFHNDTLSIYNMHLKSNKFTNNESDMVAKRSVPSINDTTLSRSKQIFRKLLHTTTNRGLEAKLIADIIQKNTQPYILCGDLNDIPGSYVYFTVKSKARDAFLERCNGIGATYLGSLPILRIDYIFCSTAFYVNTYENMDISYSDHRPQKALLSLVRSEKK